ncbi:MAG: TraM recognition domain-containing protein [Oscillospiraceae bacterium]|nr:TraM recognition domain-containing protein [Oscillospiraceae bacterium]
MSVKRFTDLSAELFKAGIIDKDDHADNVEIVGTSGKVSENSVARFSLIAESELGHIFNEDGVDIYKALQERATILFILNPLIYPELSPLFGRLVLVDAKKAVSKLFDAGIGRTFFIFDEINVYASTALIDLVNKSRSANVTCILATQSLSDLSGAEDDNFKEQVIENCNNYIVMRQNSAVNSEAWANILGTRNTMEVTYQLQAQSGGATAETGMGSAKLVREYIYHPDTIKALGTGKAFFLSRDTGQHCKVSIHKPF